MGNPIGFILFYFFVGMFGIISAVFFGLIDVRSTLFYAVLCHGFGVVILTLLAVSAGDGRSTRHRSFERRFIVEARPRRRRYE